MQIIGYQIDNYNNLYNLLVNENKPLIIFSGQKGGGKSIIIEELANTLKETWNVFLLAGTGKTSPPYYTWYAAQKSIKNKINQVSNISFGVNFQPVGLPIGINMNIGLISGQTIFNGNEQAIIKDIKRNTVEENILFLADDYSAWDQASRELLEKIDICKNDIFDKNKNIHILLVDSQINILSDISDKFKSSHIEIRMTSKIRQEDIVQIINQQPEIMSLQIHDLEKIINFTGYDLRLINLAIQYQQNNVNSFEVCSLNDLLEKRISNILSEHNNIHNLLEHVSIITSIFSEKEAAYLLDEETLNTEILLNKAVNLYLIRKRHAYDFPNPEIQKYFQEKLDIEKKYLHHRFAQYLNLYHPEDYLNRSHHLFLSEEANSDQNIVEAVYILAIEIIRRKEITGGIVETVIEEKLNEILNKLPTSLEYVINLNLKTFFKGNEELCKCNYYEAIKYFSEINIVYAPKLFAVEAMRLHLLSQAQLADDIYEIKRLADEIYNYITEDYFYEDEIWCRVALLLLEVYGDRHVNIDRFSLLKSGFESRIRKHMHKSSFRALYAKYNCKASLFYNSLISIKLTEESCDFFRIYSSTLNLYYCLCNNAANKIICGEYESANIRLQECKEIVSNNQNIIFPGTYKIDNNIIINIFLQSEGTLLDYSSRNKGKIVNAAEMAANNLEELSNKQGYEVSHIISFNLLSMFMLCNKQDKASELLGKFTEEYKDLDLFYKYYYHNIICAYNILNNDYEEALNHLNILEKMNVVLLSSYSKILMKRNNIIRQLIFERYNGDNYSYNYEFIKRGMHVQDPSASFWGRGFLLSDLQFLSL